ncbi:MAG: glycosyltransferase [Candidatus ainarchaeum sp.]|nr:glycosyltransferase [Candidatus ainarchaeum sp.]
MLYIPPHKIIDYLVSFLALYVVVLFILLYLINREKITKPVKKTNWEPKISVVIPAYNEEKNIRRCIQSLLDMDYPKNKLEIIVVDDGSKDNTYKIAIEYKKSGVKVFRKKNEGTAAATKNYGISKATGELIATLDADSYVSKNALRKILPLFDEEDVVAVTSAVKVSNPNSFLKTLQRVEYLLAVFSRRILSVIDSVFVTPGPFSVFRASVFKKVGVFDEKSILEDQEIALRMQKHNLKIRSSIDAEVFTDVPGNFFSLIRQRIRWHRGGLINSINYFHLINPKYGDFGLIVLPLSLIAIFGIFSIIFNLAFTYLFYRSISDFLYLDNLLLVFQPIHFAGIILLILTVIFSIYQIRYFKDEKLNPLWVIIYIICYAYLITLYWLLAIGKQIKGDRVSW